MRTGAPSEVLSGAAGWWPRIQAWRGGTLLADEVPVLSGRVTASVQQQVPERLTITVPRFDGRGWLPRAADDPLARFGQELSVSIVVWSAVTGAQYETRIGRYLITDWDFDDSAGTIRVTAEGLLRRVADARLTSPISPRVGGTFMSEARRLLPAGMSAGFPGLSDRSCPTSMEWSEDRLAALYEIADAWPARLRTDQWGQQQFLPPLPEIPTPVITLTDGLPYGGLPGNQRGTVIGADRSDTREGSYNVVVARSSATDVDIQAVAQQTTGPLAADGPTGPVVKFWSSPLLRTKAQAQASADTMLANSLYPRRTVPVELVPDPRIDLDDPVDLIRDGMRDWGYVVAYDLPLTVDDGAMRLDVGIAA
jgi:hypothetical protein